MASVANFDQFNLTASDLAAMTGAREGAKLVHNLTDRGIIPFRKDGRSRLYSLGSLLTLDAMIRARGAGLGLSEGVKLAEVVVSRAKERLSDLYINIADTAGWQWLIYAFDRDVDPAAFVSWIVAPTETIADLQVTLLSGWPSDVTSLFPIDRAIWECLDAFDRHHSRKNSE